MTVVQNESFTCHVCGRQYECLAVASTNDFGGPPASLPGPTCPDCGTDGRFRIGYSPGSLLDYLFEIDASAEVPRSQVERLVEGSVRVEDIEAWQTGFAKARWDRIIRGNLKSVRSHIAGLRASIRSDEPFGDFNILQQEAGRVREPNEATRRFAAIRGPEYESHAQMNRELRAMMDADPRIVEDAEEVIDRYWGRHVAGYESLLASLGKDLPAKAAAFFDEARRSFVEQVKTERARLGLQGDLPGA